MRNASILCDFNFSGAKNHLRNKEMDIGFSVNKILTDKTKTDEITKHEIDVFTAWSWSMKLEYEVSWIIDK